MGGAPRAGGVGAGPARTRGCAPFPVLTELTLGVLDPPAAFAAAGGLTQLCALTLLHLRTGARAFGPGAARELGALSQLTRLVLLPVTAAAPEVTFPLAATGGGGGGSDCGAEGSPRGADGSGGCDAARGGVAPEAGAGVALGPRSLFPRLRYYRGPPL